MQAEGGENMKEGMDGDKDLRKRDEMTRRNGQRRRNGLTEGTGPKRKEGREGEATEKGEFEDGKER